METIFDYAPTPDELRYLGDTDADTYREALSMDRRLKTCVLCLPCAAMRNDR